MAERKAYAVVKMTITREIEVVVDENPKEDEKGLFTKAIENAIEEKYGKFLDEEDGVDEADEYEILFEDWAE